MEDIAESHSSRSLSHGDDSCYPMGAYLNLVPGGIEYEGWSGNDTDEGSGSEQLNGIGNANVYDLNDLCEVEMQGLIQRCVEADVQLRSMSRSSSSSSSKSGGDVYYVPSLSVLAEAVFGSLTGVSAANVRKWADALVLAYAALDADGNRSQTSQTSNSNNSLSGWCKEVLGRKEVPVKKRKEPCGYVFKRGDIAWNCRTCQADNTCVLCDRCFRNSDHDGHEVFFHRTSPGGCCDCGDIEAWNIQGCCPLHAPDRNNSNNNNNSSSSSNSNNDSSMEAVRTSQEALMEGQQVVEACLGHSFVGSALGVVIGMAVQTVVQAVDGAGVGCDVVQWTKRWPDQVRRLRHRAAHDEDYFRTDVNNGSTHAGNSTVNSTVNSLSKAQQLPLPPKYKLHLRLHNDDVHTFEEVIDALYPRSNYSRRNPNNSSNNNNDDDESLVHSQEYAEELTHYVDSDGQVTVKSYTELSAALTGFKKLRDRGLQCVVVSTAQVDLELRAKALVAWLSDLAALHPALNALVIHALLDVSEGNAQYGGVTVWTAAHFIPPWAAAPQRFHAFPPAINSSFLSRDESQKLYQLGLSNTSNYSTPDFVRQTNASPIFYAKVPYRLPSERYRKSPHALWGTIPPPNDPTNHHPPHPLLSSTNTNTNINTNHHHTLTDALLILDTDLRKQQEAETLTTSLYPHSLLGLHLVSGIGLVPDANNNNNNNNNILWNAPPVAAPNMQEWRHLLSSSSFRAPVSPLLLLLLLDPYPPKLLRASLHSLFLTLLKDGRFKSRFASSLFIAYRPLTTLFCSGIGTEGDSPLSFTVQIFTAKSLVTALSNSTAMKHLLTNDLDHPAHHTTTTNTTNTTKTKSMMEDVYTIPIAHTVVRCIHTNLLGATKEVKMVLKHTTSDTYNNTELTYQMGESPLHTILPAAPDDCYLDSRSTRHKRLPHLYRDLEYILDTPGTASKLLRDASFVPAFCRLLRLAQGMDPQKRKINGGHVEYEQNRWVDAFGLSLNINSARDALFHDNTDDVDMLNLWMGLWRELKWWLYREGLLDTGFPSSTTDGVYGNQESLQRSTLHVGRNIALSCAVGVKMTEPQLLQMEGELPSQNPLDWLKVPHSPLSGDTLSFHLPLHRTLACSILSLCRLPVNAANSSNNRNSLQDVASWIVPAMRAGNCRVVWSGGLECTSEEAQSRRQRSRALSTKIAHTKILHSLCDHPLRCLVAASQMERHLWVRNGSGVTGMALNYSSRPTCHSFRDLDLTLVQLSAAGGPMGLGAQRVFALLLSRFTMEGYLCNPELRSDGTWIAPPRLVDSDHAIALAESFFITICILVTELPSPPPLTADDDRYTKACIQRELIHALAAEPKSYSEALSTTALAYPTKHQVSDLFSGILARISTIKKLNKANVYVLKPEHASEYDPTFYHLRRPEHQHAMETIAALRLQQTDKCWPLVAPPPPAHPTFLPSRLLLHLPAMDAALRRMLLFGLTNGQWLPPSPPATEHAASMSLDDDDVQPSASFKSKRRAAANARSNSAPFSPSVVAESSVSLMDVLQLLTLQIHTLEECASLHSSLPDIVDEESATLSRNISINSFLHRWTAMPSSLVNVWALESLPTSGNAMYKGSILGLLIALFEHRGTTTGAKTLAADGLKWLLRFVHALVHNAPSVKVAHQCATSGAPYQPTSAANPPTWSMDGRLQGEIQGMLLDLQELWPQPKHQVTSPDEQKKALSLKNRKEAQLRAMARMKAQQASFAQSIDSSANEHLEDDDGECIICKCDNPNDTLGYLGHVQRSRAASLATASDSHCTYYRVVGEKGCQLRERPDMDSPEVARLPKGSIVKLQSQSNHKHGLQSRRVFVTHVTSSPEPHPPETPANPHAHAHANPDSIPVMEGWANISSRQGYVILTPLTPLTQVGRWGSTRPILKLCGHAAHITCVETHCLSLHQRNASDQPYDGRFAANIDDGEFLCPLCKQLSNVLVPATTDKQEQEQYETDINNDKQEQTIIPPNNGLLAMESLKQLLRKTKPIQNHSHNNKTGDKESPHRVSWSRASRQYGAHLLQSMQLSSSSSIKKNKKYHKIWHPSLFKWDFDPILEYLRQWHISFAALGHTAASMEASSSMEDPWLDYDSLSRDSHPSLLELRSILHATMSLLQILSNEINHDIGPFLLNILFGNFWTSSAHTNTKDWSQLTALLAAIPCHVARDGMLNPKHEARTTATAMWIMNYNNQNNNNNINSMTEAKISSESIPIPLPMKHFLPSSTSGTGPHDLFSSSGKDGDEEFPLIRPFLASAYLYIPVLAWDLTNLAGAIFPTLLMKQGTAADILTAAQLLLTARFIQTLITPQGLAITQIEESSDMLTEEEEASSLVTLYKECRKALQLPPKENDNITPSSLWKAVSCAILPYGRTLLLLLRASISSLRQQKKSIPSNMEQFLVEQDDAFFTDDGWEVLTAMGAPMPSQLITHTEWKKTITSWLQAVSTLESYHGSQGDGLTYNSTTNEWIPINYKYQPSDPTNAATDKNDIHCNQSIEMEDVESSVDEAVGKNSGTEEQGPLLQQAILNNIHQPALEEGEHVEEVEDADSTSSPVPDEVAAVAAAAAMNVAALLNQNDLVIDENYIVGESDEEDDDDDEEMEDVDTIFVLDPRNTNGLDEQDAENQEDAVASEETSSVESSPKGRMVKDKMFAHVSSSPMIPYQPSLLGTHQVGPGSRGFGFDIVSASSKLFDLSHLGRIRHPNPSLSGLIKLPHSFVELYGYVNQIKGGGDDEGLDEADDSSSSETAICLLTGKVMKSGSSRSTFSRVSRSPGACTLHARDCGSGIGIFFLLQKCTVLLMHNNKSAYSASLYVDDHGEEDPGLRRGRPLFLNEERYKLLQELWHQHKIPREVAQIRSTSDRVIRDNWY